MFLEISDEMIEHLEQLTELELSEKEKEQSEIDIAEILNYVEMLDEQDLTGVELFTNLFPNYNVFRDDFIKAGNIEEGIAVNAPQIKNGCFVVPNTIHNL